MKSEKLCRYYQGEGQIAELESAVVAARMNPDRAGRSAMGESVREQIGEQLGDARAIAGDRPGA